jgi:hypothetical protein
MLAIESKSFILNFKTSQPRKHSNVDPARGGLPAPTASPRWSNTVIGKVSEGVPGDKWFFAVSNLAEKRTRVPFIRAATEEVPKSVYAFVAKRESSGVEPPTPGTNTATMHSADAKNIPEIAHSKLVRVT